MYKIKIVPEIKNKGYPTNNQNYPRCHEQANIDEKKETGIVHKQHHKKGTLLGSYTKDCKTIFISKETYPEKRKNVKIHEKSECKYMNIK